VPFRRRGSDESTGSLQLSEVAGRRCSKPLQRQLATTSAIIDIGCFTIITPTLLSFGRTRSRYRCLIIENGTFPIIAGSPRTIESVRVTAIDMAGKVLVDESYSQRQLQEQTTRHLSVPLSTYLTSY
jgi:hypothetical protein